MGDKSPKNMKKRALAAAQKGKQPGTAPTSTDGTAQAPPTKPAH